MYRVEVIRKRIDDFDRQLADSVKPLAYFFDGFDIDGKGTFEQKNPGDPLSNNFIFQKVIDKICTLDISKSQDPDQYKAQIEKQLEILHETLNLIQIQFKKNVKDILEIEEKIHQSLDLFLEQYHELFTLQSE